MKSSDHCVNGVSENEFLGMVSLARGETTEQDNYPWNNLQAGIR